MTLDRYLQIRKRFETGFWVILAIAFFISGSIVQRMDANRHGIDIQNWEILSWEASSMIVVLALIPLILYFDNRLPLRWSNFKVSVPAHIGFSIVFSALHVAMMVGIRKIVYWFNHSFYDFGEISEQFFYEYLKDAQTYATVLVIVYLYRHLILRLQGEASLLDVSDTDAHKVAEVKPERILVKKLGREFLIKVCDIERIEAAGNYVNIHIADRVYPLRETMIKIEQRLDDDKFRRVHRSHIINLDHLEEIKPFENGDARILLDSGDTVPMSRAYRKSIR